MSQPTVKDAVRLMEQALIQFVENHAPGQKEWCGCHFQAKKALETYWDAKSRKQTGGTR